MQVTKPPTLTAPQVTGHPQGLPGDRPAPDEQTKVKPIADARNPDARLNDGVAPTKFWSAANGKPDPDANTAPPSIMQITISRMLDEQSPRKTAPAPTDVDADSAPPTDAPKATEADTGADMTMDAPAPDDQSDAPKDARKSVLSTLP